MNELIQSPPPGGNSIHYRGDLITITLKNYTGKKGKAWVRTNIGNAQTRHTEIVRHVEEGLPSLCRDWHDVPMNAVDETTFALTLPLLSVGRFEAKCYFTPFRSRKIIWPDGANAAIKIEPAETCNGNTMYTAFVRQFGETKSHADGAVSTIDEPSVLQLERNGYAVIPPSGKFRDLIQQLDFIVGTLRCKIVQLLPIHPVPTTYARMGRFGSPFAVMDLLDVDPAYAEFDKQTTPLDQFQELVDEVHRRNARIYLDMPINHTGWASHLQIEHPEWFVRSEDDSFVSPGAWGVTWGDLSKLDYTHRDLWTYIANVFLYWCSHGVDGFRCDAGYKIPFEVWEYVIAKVRTEYPDTIFMLEGLGGHKQITEHLLADAGMNWAYSELFQNYNQSEIESYLPEAIHVSETKGNLIHFSETHDNARIAAVSQAFARLRVALCTLASQGGAVGFANGVEWYATTQINVHSCHSLNWGHRPNMVKWIQRLHAIIEIHPVFFPNSSSKLIQHGHHNSIALLRKDVQSKTPLLILANLNAESDGVVLFESKEYPFGDSKVVDLISGEKVELEFIENGLCKLELNAVQIVCLSDDEGWVTKINRLLKDPYKGSERAMQQTFRAKALDIHHILSSWKEPCSVQSELLAQDPKKFCLDLAGERPCVTLFEWLRDNYRTILLPPDHFLLVQADHAFIADLKFGRRNLCKEKSLPMANGRHFALIEPLETPQEHQELTLKLTIFEPEGIRHGEASVLQLTDGKNAKVINAFAAGKLFTANRYAICTNQHGALSQVRIAWGELRSKYDALLAANLHPDYPVDRHVMFTRCRGWINYKGYSSELTLQCQKKFSISKEGTVHWLFSVPVGTGNLMPLKLSLCMDAETNTILLTYSRLPDSSTQCLDDSTTATLVLRPDIEDRSNHEVTKAFAGPEEHWPQAIQSKKKGFSFVPAPDRRLEVRLDKGQFFQEPEWYYMQQHPFDSARGMDGSSDLFSPGYFRVELKCGESVSLSAAINPPHKQNIAHRLSVKHDHFVENQSIEEAMYAAMQQFIVKRDRFKTVIAGYPWFLDWGRDTLICLRGIIRADLLDESRDILTQFAKFEKGGTIPNMIRGDDDNNRETSDAPLWFFVACDELIKARKHSKLLQEDCGGRSLKEVLISIATNYINGTENGIVVDWDSGLVFSPSHYTWMDTNYPAGTPRQGYPIEIQALWHYALRMLSRIDPMQKNWKKFADLVQQSITQYFVIKTESCTYLADCLSAELGEKARQANVDDALRSNQLLAITLGALKDRALSKSILDSCEQLLIPGAIRSLADQPVKHPCPVYHHGQLLNDPQRPYWGHYEGDEDSKRKPAYHNGTAWTWPFPSYPEALVKVYGKKGVKTAMDLLGSATHLINNGCLRQCPEIVDGNTPHHQRGCGAQAWGVTELYRVIKMLQ